MSVTVASDRLTVFLTNQWGALANLLKFPQYESINIL